MKISSWSSTWKVKSSSYSSNQIRPNLRPDLKNTWIDGYELKTDRLRSLNRGKTKSRIISNRCSNWVYRYDQIKIWVRERWITWASLISLKREQVNNIRERGTLMNVLNKSLSTGEGRRHVVHKYWTEENIRGSSSVQSDEIGHLIGKRRRRWREWIKHLKSSRLRFLLSKARRLS